MALPPFHAMGIYMQLYASLAGGHPIGLFAPRAPALPVVPTPQLTLQVSKIIGCTGIPTVPAFVEVIFLIILIHEKHTLISFILVMG